MAFSLTADFGCEHGGGVSCYANSAQGPKQDFLGFMFYNRVCFDHDLFGVTIGGGEINNPGRYRLDRSFRHTVLYGKSWRSL